MNLESLRFEVLDLQYLLSREDLSLSLSLCLGLKKGKACVIN